MLRGDHRSHGHIDVLPMRIRSAVQHIGHDCLDIAAGVRIHNLSVRTGRTMPSSPFLVLFFVATTLTLAHTAPDTETLIMVDGPFQTLFTDFTLGANPLRIPGGTAFSGKNASGSVCEHSALYCQDTSSSRLNKPHSSASGFSEDSSVTPHMSPPIIVCAPFMRILSHRFKLHTRNVILSSFPVSMPIFQKIHAKVQPNLGSTVAESVKIGH